MAHFTQTSPHAHTHCRCVEIETAHIARSGDNKDVRCAFYTSYIANGYSLDQMGIVFYVNWLNMFYI